MKPAFIAALAAASAVAAGGAAAVPVLNTPYTNVSFVNAQGLTIPAKLYFPNGILPPPPAGYPAVVLLHGCSGVYANGTPNATFTNVQSIYAAWGDALRSRDYVALLVDSFTPRKPGVANQSECSQAAGTGISEVTDRPLDVAAAHAYLAAHPYVDDARIGVIGWSHGASTVMSTLSTTEYNSSSVRAEASTKPFKVGVAWYPGCGLKWGGVNGDSAFGGITSSQWRPYVPLQIFHGTHDKLYDNTYNAATDTVTPYDDDPNDPTVTIDPLRFKCSWRVRRAIDPWGAGAANGNAVTLTVYDHAHHSFDYPPPTGEAGPCVDSATNPDACAREASDPAALQTLDAFLKDEPAF